MNEIDPREAKRLNNKFYSDFKSDSKNNKFHEHDNPKPSTINETIKYNLNSLKKLCNTCIKIKYKKFDIQKNVKNKPKTSKRICRFIVL